MLSHTGEIEIPCGSKQARFFGERAIENERGPQQFQLRAERAGFAIAFFYAKPKVGGRLSPERCIEPPF